MLCCSLVGSAGVRPSCRSSHQRCAPPALAPQLYPSRLSLELLPYRQLLEAATLADALRRFTTIYGAPAADRFKAQLAFVGESERTRRLFLSSGLLVGQRRGASALPERGPHRPLHVCASAPQARSSCARWAASPTPPTSFIGSVPTSERSRRPPCMPSAAACCQRHALRLSL